MYEELNEQLVRIKGNLKKKQVWEKQVTEYQKELTELRNTISQLENKLNEDKMDIQKLETISITNLFVTVLGKKEDRLDKDKQDIVKIQLQLDAATKSKNDIVHELDDLQTKLAEVQDSEYEYEQILFKKESLIKDSQSPYSIELYNLSHQEADINAYLVELTEAVDAGEEVYNALCNAVHSLEKAQNWGTYDMLGGGLIATSVKHNHLDSAKEFVNEAQSKMRKFQKELSDVDEMTDVHIDISDMLKFADFFFDGLIVDWMVQGKINHALKQAEDQQYKIKSILEQLKRKVKENQGNLANVKKTRKELVESLS